MHKLRNRSFIFWGTGSLSKRIFNDVLMRGLKIEMYCFIDNDVKKAGQEILGKSIYHAEDIHKIKTDPHIIVICSSFEKEISEQLIELGFNPKTDFITYKEFNEYLAYLTAIEQIEYYDELKVIVGAAQTNQKGWIATNKSYLDLLNKEDWLRLFGTRKIQDIVGEHVWEHLTYNDGVTAARHCFEQLQEGGRLRIAIPDGNHPNPYYIHWVRPNGFGDAADDHKELYTHEMLEQMLKDAGFTKIEKLEYFDDKGNFHAINWDAEEGYIKRSKENDPRNWKGNIVYSSLIVDGIK